jgi:chromatin segregation and condensation protein Rec8/ScpA/Scc1 (kleisin family)
MRRKTALLALASAALLAPLAAQAQMPSPETIFKAWDKNADGFVDKTEWVAAGRKETSFTKVDTDADGKVTLEELTSAMARRKAQRQERRQEHHKEQGAPEQTPPATPPADH